MKVLVTGWRDWPDDVNGRAIIRAVLGHLSSRHHGEPLFLIHGGARGADLIAAEIGADLGYQVRSYPAEWAKHGKSAGPRRNQRMLVEEHRPDEPIDLVAAFPGPESVGTWDMIERARKASLAVVIRYSRPGMRSAILASAGAPEKEEPKR